MNTRISFSKRALDALPPAAKGARDTYHDTGKQAVNGLLLRVTDTGAKTFGIQQRINGRVRRVTLGRFPMMTVEQARSEAKKTLSEVVVNRDPVAEKRARNAAGVTLGEVFAAYLQGRKNLKPGTVADYQRVMNEGLADWTKKPIKGITREMVERRHAALGKASKARANNTMRVLRALFNFALSEYELPNGEPLVAVNPVKALSHRRSWFDVQRRRTVIKPNQLKPWFEAVLALESSRRDGQAAVARDYFLFLILTGLRRTEAARLQWSDVDLDNQTFLVRDTKNKRAHELPLSDYLFALLKRRSDAAGDEAFVFAVDSEQGHIRDPRFWMERVSAASGVPFALHDLRRTFATVAESLDIPAYALKRLLNHQTGADVTAGYLVMSADRLRGPMQKITDYILRAAGIRGSAEVVALSPAERASLVR